MADSSHTTTTIDPAFAGAEPASVWRYFSHIARIPRASGNEAGVRDYVQQYAASRGFACEVNEVGDVLLRVRPDAPGPVVALQAHMDMVCVSEPGVTFDFAKEAIRLRRDGDFIRADGTTLGADNGIGIAYALALADDAEGPLEVLLTVDEERGFSGVEGVAPGWLKANFLINLDSEEEGFVTIASAGARDFKVTLPVRREAPPVAVEPLLLTVGGLKGGHSGVEIHRGRTNALKVAGLALAKVRACGGYVCAVQGGMAPNVIPSSSSVLLGVPPERVADLREQLSALQQALITQEDPNLRIDVSSGHEVRQPLCSRSVDQLVALLAELPTGVIVPSPRDATQPFVSNNVAVLGELETGAIQLTMMSRSPASEELEKLAERYRAVAQSNGASMVAGRLVPGWAPNYDSPLLALFQKKHREQYGKNATVLEIHAGLECGALQTKYPGMDLISVGPDITDVHSVQEKVSIASTRRVFELVRSVVRELGTTPPKLVSA
ncbi:MAG: beta-Ala-His dipeptidase [Polyangiaceae bacterium]|nr:beta-Ala-His dipeptidase [Polyangiaceae bacterium]